MKIFQWIYFPALALLPLCFAFCTETFIPDPDHPDLPKYTEDGNMIAGAYINNIPWRTQYRVGDGGVQRGFYFLNSQQGDSVILSFEGYCLQDSVETPVDLEVVLKGIQVNKTEDLLNLGGQFLLDGSMYYAILDGSMFISPDSNVFLQHGVGIFTVKNIREVKEIKLTHDNGEAYHPVIISGIFNFTFDPGNIRVDLGRFDYRVDDGFIVQKP